MFYVAFMCLTSLIEQQEVDVDYKK